LLRDAKKGAFDATISCVLAKRMLGKLDLWRALQIWRRQRIARFSTATRQTEDCSGAAVVDKQIRSRNRVRNMEKPPTRKHLSRKMDLVGCRATSPSFDKLCGNWKSYCHRQQTKVRLVPC